MRDYSKDFQTTDGQVWLNAASEGPIPKSTAQALQEAIGWKLAVHQLTIPKFQQVPLELKQSIARLINVDAADIILGNSATYGIHLLANGLPLKAGDEVVLMRNDFPTDILPWLHLAKKGVVIHQLKPAGEVLTPKEVELSFNKRTKVVCLPQIHSFSGWDLDIAAIGNICRKYGILFIANMSQSIGAFEVNVDALPVDAVVCAGYKWMLGPYGTGFCWMKPQVREQLDYPQAYWISLMDEQSLVSTGEISLKESHLARRYDMFGTANFFNYVPWRASVEYLLNIGMKEVGCYNQSLVERFIQAVDLEKFDILSPKTNIIVFSHKNKERNAYVHEYLKSKGIHTALWKGQLRVSPHIYNTFKDIDYSVAVLNACNDK